MIPTGKPGLVVRTIRAALTQLAVGTRGRHVDRPASLPARIDYGFSRLELVYGALRQFGLLWLEAEEIADDFVVALSREDQQAIALKRRRSSSPRQEGSSPVFRW